MSVTGRLVFDPAETASSHNVGSYVRAGTDGTLIGAVSDALKVNFSNTSLAVTATDLDIRDLTHVSDSVKIGDGTDFLAIDASGNIGVTDAGGSLTVDAVDLDIRDLSSASDSVAGWVFAGTDGTAIGHVSDALKVNIASGFVDADDSLANTAIFTESRAVSTSAITITAAASISNRKWLYTANLGNKILYIGPSGVTAADGFPLFPGNKDEFRIGAAVAPYVIGETGASSEDLRVMQLS